MSGHNKWSQIKRQKGATDAKRSKIFSKHAALIAIASREAAGNLASPSLATAIDRAKRDNMPKENIDRAVAKGTGAGGASIEPVLYETFGPGGVALLITGFTDNTNRTSQEIRHLLSKNGYALGTPGSSSWAFQKSDDGYVATMPIDLSDDDAEKLGELIDLLEDHPDIQDVYTSANDAD
ncbi:hypothetical protein A3C89_03380 [Candidatus Kaiserbacteria bacterium RIFCSPHIGHO2_02_FULL_50_50]|uniref:Transcriptional regulator n=1 Tax=Candidatus Kaiserbacteria bacterium RIFCSPHIGHO2_02_FULL_50_50 TaxID=1798492 RepID=A0A1F6DF13_9BACT|nr:MAG: hypothetical protein A3C89_03380 [Candidatus Kaiserbacteria bacterium RIFCSPHIGHO2_02_FULL_50_50]OGG89229.1 MAG: hypothetical protein A3G62_01240 [Candidatus Kaiserbacteria bacterium RIFCSPLOWO2_12_FULL_50_10]